LSRCFAARRLDDARRLANCSPIFSIASGLPPALRALGDIATHPDRFDAEQGEAHYRRALALAEPRGAAPHRPLPSRAEQAVSTHQQAGANPRIPHYRNDDTARWTCASGWSRRKGRRAS
jgi:hypothetical protein